MRINTTLLRYFFTYSQSSPKHVSGLSLIECHSSSDYLCYSVALGILREPADVDRSVTYGSGSQSPREIRR